MGNSGSRDLSAITEYSNILKGLYITESIPKSAFTTVFGKFEFLRLPFGLSQGPDVFINLIYDLFGLNKGQGCDIVHI